MTECKILFRGFHPDENGKIMITLPQVSKEVIAEKEKKLTDALNNFNLAYAAKLNDELEALNAKRNVKVKGDWVYGDLINCGIKGGKYIHPQGNGFEVSKTDLTKLLIVHKVFPETVGQWVTTDKNGKDVFYDDIVKDSYGRVMRVVYKHFKPMLELVSYDKSNAWTNNFKYADLFEWFDDNVGEKAELIGNKWEREVTE